MRKVYKQNDFVIKEKDLAKSLGITPERLDEVIAFFDSDPNDEWDLVEGDHYLYLDKKWQHRIFSEQGAFAVAKYLDTIENKNVISILVVFFTRRKEKTKKALVQNKIMGNCSSLTLRGDQHFLSKSDVVSILNTSYARLKQAFEDIKVSDQPLELGVDFDDFDGVRYYSLSGFYRLSRNLSENLTKVDRRDWCSSVYVVAKKVMKELISKEAGKERRIAAAVAAAKKRDRCCQVTGERPTKHNKIELAAHHIYSAQHYPHWVESIDNLITLSASVHKEFHAWNGGNKVESTPDKLISFIIERYPEAENALARASEVKTILKV